MKILIAFIITLCIFSSFTEMSEPIPGAVTVASGQMPNMANDKNNTIHLVFGRGDSIMYSYASSNTVTFSRPTLVFVLPKAFTFAMRGPQIAVSESGILVTACNSLGDIYTFYKVNGGNWIQKGKLNDVDTIAKEGLMSVSADGESAFAVWLDLRGNDKNKIYGAGSANGGKTWSKNVLVYASPDSTVCECCKPSVAVKGRNIYVMFRNSLNGNRDMYLVQSSDGGKIFGKAQKLGIGNWKLNGCPMDGGGLALDSDGKIQTVWRRENKIYSAIPGMPEKEIGEGRGCTMTNADGKNVYAWSEKGEIVIVTPHGQKKVLGKGSQPIVKSINHDQVICMWENEKQIQAMVVQL